MARFTSGYMRSVAVLALSVSLPALCAAQSVNERSNDARVGLKPGMTDAGEAASGMARVASLAKPPVFDPPPPPAAPGTNPRMAGNGLKYANSDLAFGGKTMFVGNFYGMTFYDISNPEKIKLQTTVVCPGGQGDVSVYGHLLFMSVEAADGRNDCGQQGIPLPAGYEAPARPARPAPAADGAAPAARAPRAPQGPGPASMDRMRGVRIFDITDINNPKQVATVQTCRGSHTHTLVEDPNDKENIYFYVSGSSNVRNPQELTGCSGADPDQDPNTALYSIVVVKVPLAHPDQAKVVNTAHIFTDEQTGKIDGLWKGGNHGDGTQTTSGTRGCHDITVYPAIGLAAGACSGNGILLDIKDVVHPKRIDAVTDANYAFWHSASFSNDGSKVLFTDEWGGGTQPRCRESDPMKWGADAIFNLNGGKLSLASYYKMPAAQTETENCVAHNGSLIPIPGRDIEVQGWYQGGISIVDWTDTTHPVEIAYYDRGPIDPSKLVVGGDWAAYWYNGYIYASEIARGVDVFKLLPSKYVSENEIAAAKLVQVKELNVQDQQKLVWPSNFTIAKAYVDQLERDSALPADRIAALKAAVAKADKSHSKKGLAPLAASLDKDAASASPVEAKRMSALSALMK